MSDEEQSNKQSSEQTSDQSSSNPGQQLQTVEKPWQFKKGQSGNPKGRPKNGRSARAAALVKIESRAQLEAAARALTARAVAQLEREMAQGDKSSARIMASQTLIKLGFPDSYTITADDESRSTLTELLAIVKGHLRSRQEPPPIDITPGPDGTYHVEVVPPKTEE